MKQQQLELLVLMSPIFKKRICFKCGREGFSLIEVVVYVALLAILLVAVTGTLLAVSKTSRELVAWQSLQSEGSSVMDRLAKEIRGTEALVGGGIFDTDPGQLVLSTGGLSGGEVTNTEIGVDGNNDLYLNVGGGSAVVLTSRTEVRSLVFRQITSSTTDAVRIELVLGTKPGLVDKTMNLYNTVILRSSYGQ